VQLENSQLNVDDTAGHRSVRVPLSLHCAGDVGLVSATGESRVITTLSVVETFKSCDTATATRSLPCHQPFPPKASGADDVNVAAVSKAALTKTESPSYRWETSSFSRNSFLY
jgi:hypothetical protein